MRQKYKINPNNAKHLKKKIRYMLAQNKSRNISAPAKIISFQNISGNSRY
jgi:mannitol-1-phosphate/altronate dehydrogenase